MDRFQKFSVYLLIILGITVSFEFFHVQAIPAPSVNSTCEPGACASGGSYTFSVYVDASGPSYLAQKMKGGGNAYKETEPNTLFADIQADSACTSNNGCSVYVNSGVYTMTTNILITISGLSIIGSGMNSTIFDSSGYQTVGASKGSFTIGKASTTLQNLYICCLEIKNLYVNTNANFDIVNNNPVNNIIIEKIHGLNAWNCIVGINSQNVAGASRSVTIRDTLSEQEGCGPQFYDIWYGRMEDNKVIASRDDAYAELATVAQGSRDVLIIANTGDWSGTRRVQTFVASLIKIDGSNIAGSISELIVQSNWGYNAPTGINAPSVGSQNVTLAYNNILGGSLSNRGLSLTTVSNYTITGNFVKGMATADLTLDSSTPSCNQLTITDNWFLSNSPANGNVWYSGGPIGKNVFFKNNHGYDPIGKVASPFASTNFMVPGGTASASPTASIAYIVTGVDVYFTSSAGTGVSITIKDAGGNTVYAPGATLSVPFLVFVGWTVNFGAFSVAPTVTVWGD